MLDCSGPLALGLDEITVIQELRCREGNVKNWTMDLTMPKVDSGKPRQAIVVIPGGGWIEGDISNFSRPVELPPGNLREFANQGYVAATITDRLADEAPFPATFTIARTPSVSCELMRKTTTSIPIESVSGVTQPVVVLH